MLRVMILALASATASAVLVGAAGARGLPQPAAGSAVPVATAAAQPAPRAGWGWPLGPVPAVVRPFHAPPTPWSAGHRGVDLRARVGQPVLSAADGRVTFAGMVAGRGVVVLTHAGGLRTSYEPVGAAATVGRTVTRGTRIGVVAGAGGHCGPIACLHWGMRRGAVYLDPLACVRVDPPVLKPLFGEPALAAARADSHSC